MKPLLFVDVDGVLNYLGPTRDGDLFDLGVSWPATNDANLDRLAEAFDPVWATAWGGGANIRFGRDWPVVELGAVPPWAMMPGRGSWKLTAIADYAAVRSFAWIDDDFHDDMERFAEANTAAGIPTLIIPIHNHAGLMSATVEVLVAWAASLDG